MYNATYFLEHFTATSLIVYLAILILEIVAVWKVFEKAGLKGWMSLIPFYSSYKEFELVYGDGWKFLLLLIPFANIFFAIKFYFDLAKVFGEGTAFGFGLFLANAVFIPILAFCNYEYIGPLKKDLEVVQNS